MLNYIYFNIYTSFNVFNKSLYSNVLTYSFEFLKILELNS